MTPGAGRPFPKGTPYLSKCPPPLPFRRPPSNRTPSTRPGSVPCGHGCAPHVRARVERLGLPEFGRAMVLPDQDRLAGRIEAGGSYLGCQEECLCGPQASKTAIVAIAVAVNRERISRARLCCVPCRSSSSLRNFVADVVLQGSSINIGGWYACEGLANRSGDDRLTTTSRVGYSSSQARAATLLER